MKKNVKIQSIEKCPFHRAFLILKAPTLRFGTHFLIRIKRHSNQKIELNLF